jgi:ABC-2 type transport system ATP-binding protein
VPAGRVVALVGPNGSGKTTLMSMAAGLLPASTGRVEAAGGAPAQRLDKIGFPASQYWPLQLILLAVLLAAAAGALASGWRATRARAA